MASIALVRKSSIPAVCPYTLQCEIYPGDSSYCPVTDASIDWGDGQTEVIPFELIFGYNSIEHVYDVAGTFTIRIHFTSGGSQQTTTHSNFITTTAPTLYFTSNIPIVNNRLATFENLDVPSGGSADNGYEWDFGDDTPVSTIEDPTHTFSVIGSKFIEERFANLSAWTNLNLASATVSGGKVTLCANHGTTDEKTNGLLITSKPYLYEDLDITATLEYTSDGRAGNITVGKGLILLFNDYGEIFAYVGLRLASGSQQYFQAKAGYNTYESPSTSVYGDFAGSYGPIYVRITREGHKISVYEKSNRTYRVWAEVLTGFSDRSITNIMLSQINQNDDLYPRFEAIWSELNISRGVGDTYVPISLTAISDTNVRTTYTKRTLIKTPGIVPSISLLPATIYENDTITLTNSSFKGYAIESSSYEINWDDGLFTIVEDFDTLTKLYKYYVGDKDIIITVIVHNMVDSIVDKFVIEFPIHISKRQPVEPTSVFRLEHIGSNDDGIAHVYPFNYNTGIEDPPSGTDKDTDELRWGSYFDGRYVNQVYLCTNYMWTTLLSVIKVVYDTVTGTTICSKEYIDIFNHHELNSNSPLNILGKADKSGVYHTLFKANPRNGLGLFVGIVSQLYSGDFSSFTPVINDTTITGATKKRMGRVHPVSGKFYEIANQSWYYPTPSMPDAIWQPTISVWQDDQAANYHERIQYKMLLYYDYNYLTGLERYSSFSSYDGLWLEFLDNNTIVACLRLAGSSVPTESGILHQNYSHIICYLDVSTLTTYKTVFLEPEARNSPDQQIVYSHRFMIYGGKIMFVSKTGDLIYISEEVPVPASYNCPHVYYAKLTKIRSKLSDGTYKQILYNIDKVDGEITCTIRKGANRLSQIHQFSNVVDFISESSMPTAAHYWEFGDGGYSSLVSPTHIYSEPGTYTVTLTVTNGTESAVSSSTVFVSEPYPVVDIDVIWFDDNLIPSRVGFESVVTLNEAMDETITSYQWKLNGTVIASTRTFDVYLNTVGTNIITLTVTNSYGKTSTATTSVTVGALPVAKLSPTKMKTTPALYPLTIQFISLSDTFGLATTYLWDFGDGTTSTEEDPLHQYTEPGDFDVTLTVTNSYGSSTATGFIRVIEWATMVEFIEIVRIQDIGRKFEFKMLTEIVNFIDKGIGLTILSERVDIHGDRGPRERQGHDEHAIGHIVETINEFGLVIRNAISEIGTHITQAISYKFRSGASEIPHVEVCKEMVLIDTIAEEQE